MKLICARCFVNPARVRGKLPRGTSDLVVLSAVRYGHLPAANDEGEPPLRCDYCRGEVRVDGHCLSWYRR